MEDSHGTSIMRPWYGSVPVGAPWTPGFPHRTVIVQSLCPLGTPMGIPLDNCVKGLPWDMYGT